MLFFDLKNAGTEQRFKFVYKKNLKKTPDECVISVNFDSFI